MSKSLFPIYNEIDISVQLIVDLFHKGRRLLMPLLPETCLWQIFARKLDTHNDIKIKLMINNLDEDVDEELF